MVPGNPGKGNVTGVCERNQREKRGTLGTQRRTSRDHPKAGRVAEEC